MLVACEAGYRNVLLFNTAHLTVELVDAARRSDGSETGEIAITDLRNLGMPFIRYVSGDVATRKGPWHSVGPHGLPRLQRIEGRSLDAIRTTDGNVLPGAFFPHMLKDVTGVRRLDRKSTRLNSSHSCASRMPSSACKHKIPTTQHQ